MFNITIIGIGAMGGGIARSLLRSSVSNKIIGYDQSETLSKAFYEEALNAVKVPSSVVAPPTSLEKAILPNGRTDFCVIVLQNEAQCDEVCFGGGGGSNLLNLLSNKATVILCSTVTPHWSKTAAQRFAEKKITFVDCPISGGPVRAEMGDLTLLASCGLNGSDDTAGLEKAMPVLKIMGRAGDIHIIPGGAGQGSMVKMVHQLLAGVHICVAAEALALAAKAGISTQQMYDIVNGAAGASWMFTDRGKRMIEDSDEVKSQLQIFVKDLDIVYQEARRLQSPIPVASAALQQFIAGQSLGLGRKDDSKLVKVYENVTKVPVANAKTNKKEGDQVGDLWKMEDGYMEEILEVGSEPRHHIEILNEYVRAIRVQFPSNDTTLAHRHANDSLYFFLTQTTINVVNHVQGSDPACDCMEFGEVRFGTHVEKPLIHKITNKSEIEMICIDAEVLKQPPVTSLLPLIAEKHEMIKKRDKCNVYKLTLEPGESVTVTYPFFHLSVILQSGTVTKEIAGPIQWTTTLNVGDLAWNEPVHEIKKTNVGETTFVEFIAEWR